MHPHVAAFVAFLPIVWATLTFRMFPFVAYAVVSERITCGGKGVALLGFSSCVAAALLHDRAVLASLVAQGVCFGYFSVCAVAVWKLASQVQDWNAPKHAPLCFGLFFACVAIPKVCLPAPANAVAVPFGWEFSLAAYSYVREVRREHQCPPLADGMFFLLVNPVLVYAERSRTTNRPALDRRHCARVALGVLALLLHCGMLAIGAVWIGAPFGLSDVHGASRIALLIVQHALQFLGAYVLFSATASVQIGTLRMLGYSLPERFAYPLLATNPADFWRRWNTYVGSWARRYLFLPLTIAMRRSLRGRPGAGAISVGLAAMATFMLVGLYHDLGAFVAHGNLGIGCVVTFTISGMILLAWSQVARDSAHYLASVWPTPPVIGRRAWSAFSRLSFLALMLLNAWIASATTGASVLTIDGVWRWLGGAF